jgi:hypothetical protein
LLFAFGVTAICAKDAFGLPAFDFGTSILNALRNGVSMTSGM